VLARGGGSLEDLLPFSSELVVRAVAASPIPVVSAVGHEIDYCLADLAADLRAPTPSAAAELVSAERTETLRNLAELGRGLLDSMQARLERIRLGLAPFAADQIERNMRIQLQPWLLRCDDAKEALLEGVRLAAERGRARYELAARTLEAGSPESILKRGYAIVELGPRRLPVGSAERLAPGDKVAIRFHKGEADAEIQAVRPGQ
jgi:exodeoxyribonuclease VII large subunit